MKLELYNSLFLLIFCISHTLAQTAILERNVTLEIKQEPISEALKKISQQANFIFSYNPSLIEVSKVVSISLQNKTVREALQALFQDNIIYKEKGKYLILQKSEEDENSKYFFVSGYILDYQTGKKIAQASVYEPHTFASAVSNQYGYYQIRLPAKPESIENYALTIKAIKQNYQAQKITLDDQKTQNLNIILNPELADTLQIIEFRRQDSLAIRQANPTLPDSLIIRMVEEKSKERASLAQRLKGSVSEFWASTNQMINAINIKDILSKKWQVGLVPYLTTNQLIGNTEVNFSLNLIAGYNSSVRKAEIGGAVNVVRNQVNGFQVAGLFNFVGQEVKAFQVAGLGNIVGGNVQYVQTGGLFNLNAGEMTGFQAGGLFNLNTKASKGMQAAGLFNLQLRGYRGIQVAGLFNFTTGEMKGVQIGSIFNFAKKINKGVQIGLFNYADSAGTVIPIGLFNFIRKGGYHPIELSVNEMEFSNFTFKTGAKPFYTILTVGMQPHQASKRLWHFGYGIGTYWTLTKRLAVNLDLTAHQISQDSFSKYVNILNRASFSVEVRGKWLGIAFGPAWNLLITDVSSPEYQPIFDNFPNLGFVKSERIDSDFRLRSWVGGQVAVRFGKIN
jgi:hypothetical protein